MAVRVIEQTLQRQISGSKWPIATGGGILGHRPSEVLIIQRLEWPSAIDPKCGLNADFAVDKGCHSSVVHGQAASQTDIIANPE